MVSLASYIFNAQQLTVYQSSQKLRIRFQDVKPQYSTSTNHHIRPRALQLGWRKRPHMLGFQGWRHSTNRSTRLEWLVGRIPQRPTGMDTQQLRRTLHRFTSFEIMSAQPHRLVLSLASRRRTGFSRIGVGGRTHLQKSNYRYASSRIHGTLYQEDESIVGQHMRLKASRRDGSIPGSAADWWRRKQIGNGSRESFWC